MRHFCNFPWTDMVSLVQHSPSNLWSFLPQVLEQHFPRPWTRQRMAHSRFAAQPRMKSRESKEHISKLVHTGDVEVASYQIIPQQLHDQGRVLVAFFTKGV